METLQKVYIYISFTLNVIFILGFIVSLRYIYRNVTLIDKCYYILHRLEIITDKLELITNELNI